MNFIVTSLAIGLAGAGLYYLTARWYLQRLEKARERTRANIEKRIKVYVSRNPLPPMPTRPMTQEEQVRLVQLRLNQSIRDSALHRQWRQN